MKIKTNKSTGRVPCILRRRKLRNYGRASIKTLVCTGLIVSMSLAPMQTARAVSPEIMQAKVNAVKKGVQDLQASGGDPRLLMSIGEIMSRFVPLIQAGNAEEAETTLDKALELLKTKDQQNAPGIIQPSGEFANSQPIVINGYDGGAMEPFISRDGRYLFFNNNDGKNAKICYARKVNDTTFTFMGEVGGVNAAQAVVPSMDHDGAFFFTTTRSYGQDFMTVYRGTFENGTVTNISPVIGLSRKQSPWFNMDAEISADGNTLYFTENQASASGPTTSTIGIAARNPDGNFTKLSDSDKIMKNINTTGLNYAPDVAPDGLAMFFSRALSAPLKPPLYMYVATRNSTSEPFRTPRRITAADGNVEAPSISADGKYLYYHKVLSPNNARIYMLTRQGY